MTRLFSYSLLLSLTLLSSSASRADLFLGIYAGASAWQADFSGDLGDDPQSFNSLGFNNDNYNSFYVAVELLGLPEIRLAQTNIDTTASGTLNSSFSLDGISYPVNSDLTTELDLKSTDLTIYWQILDNYIGADIGITARHLDGSVEVTDGTTTDRLDFDTLIPMGFLRARFDLPTTGWYIEADTQFIGFQGDSYSDSTAKIGWRFESIADLGINLGYRKMSIDVDGLDSLDTDLDLSGPFVSGTFHF